MTEYEKLKLGYRYIYELKFTYKDKKGNEVFSANVFHHLSNPEWLDTKPKRIKYIFNLYKSAHNHNLERLLCNGTLHFNIIKCIGFLRTQKPNLSYSNQKWIFKK